VPSPEAAVRPSFASWLIALVPLNPFKAAADGDILPLIVFTVPFALALTRIRAELRASLIDVVRAIAETMFVLLRWILWATPLAVFCLSFAIAARAGAASAGAVVIFIVLTSALLAAATLLLYPLASVVGKVSMARFARAVAPAQIVAASTRSSLAALPALIEGAEQRLGLARSVTGLVLPLSVATFKLNRTVSSTAKLLFLAHIYGIPLAPVEVVTFAATVLLISFSTPGIPSAGTMATLPVYLSFGIPIEGIVILNAVDAIPDIFKTILNVTGDLTAAAMVARMSGTPAVAPQASARGAAEVAG
jgi:Na+/H+-dicarboxylate symporter